mgnify:CR=1 FL=1
MTIDSFKFRYINAQCYEFILPNGKHLITDPYITPTNWLDSGPFMSTKLSSATIYY